MSDAVESSVDEANEQLTEEASSESSGESASSDESTGDEQEAAGSDSASDETETASGGTFSLGGVSRSLGGVFGTTSALLNGVTDAESAEAALPRLERASGTLDDVAAQYENAPESARGPLQGVIDDGLARIRPLIDTVMTREGVASVLSPVVEPMLETLQGLSEAD